MTNTQRIESLENSVNLLIKALNQSTVVNADAQPATQAGAEKKSTAKQSKTTAKKSTAKQSKTKTTTVGNSDPKYKYTIKSDYAILSESGNFRKRVQQIQWGNNTPKLDIRTWVVNDAGVEEPRKGITLNVDEAKALRDALDKALKAE